MPLKLLEIIRCSTYQIESGIVRKLLRHTAAG